MLPWTISILFLAFLYSTSRVNSSNIKTIKFNRTFESYSKLKLAHDHQRHKIARDSSWTYALCSSYRDESPSQCSIVFETNKPDGPVYREICQLGLSYPKPDNVTEKHFRVFQFGRDKSIVVWHDSNNTAHFYTVRFPTCKVTEFKMDLSGRLFGTQLHLMTDKLRVFSQDNDKYDVFYANKTADEFIFWYRISLDANSNVIEGPTEFLKVDLKSMKQRDPHWDEERDASVIFLEVEDASMGGYMMVTRGANEPFKMWHIDNRGEKKEMLSYDELEEYDGGYLLHLVYTSTANGIFGACHSYSGNNGNTTLRCEQHDRRGRKILQVNFETGYQSRYNAVQMYNLPGGGFLLFMWPCINPDCQNESQLYVTKIDAKGVRYRTLEIMNYTENYFRARDGFFVNGPGEYCWYESIAKPYEPLWMSGYTYEITYACFTDAQLSAVY